MSESDNHIVARVGNFHHETRSLGQVVSRLVGNVRAHENRVGKNQPFQVRQEIQPRLAPFNSPDVGGIVTSAVPFFCRKTDATTVHVSDGAYDGNPVAAGDVTIIGSGDEYICVAPVWIFTSDFGYVYSIVFDSVGFAVAPAAVLTSTIGADFMIPVALFTDGVKVAQYNTTSIADLLFDSGAGSATVILLPTM